VSACVADIGNSNLRLQEGNHHLRWGEGESPSRLPASLQFSIRKEKTLQKGKLEASRKREEETIEETNTEKGLFSGEGLHAYNPNSKKTNEGRKSEKSVDDGKSGGLKSL